MTTTPLDHAHDAILTDLAAELERAGDKFGPQLELPDGTGPRFELQRDYARWSVDQEAKAGTLTWLAVLDEEVLEAWSETDPDALVAELVQVAAVAVRWAIAVRSRGAMLSWAER